MKKSTQLVLPFGETGQAKPQSNLKVPTPMNGLITTSELSLLGLSSNDEALLDTIVELGARYRNELPPSSQPLANPTEVAKFAEDRLKDVQNLGYLLILVDTKHKVTHTHFYETAPLVRTVLRRAVARTASAFFIARNEFAQPSLTYSDKDLIQQLDDDGQTVGIHLLDFLVVGNGKYASAREKGIL